MKLVHWLLMGGLLHLVQRWGDWPLLDVPNVTAQPSTASVPTTVLQYNGPLLCSFNMGIKGLICHYTQCTNVNILCINNMRILDFCHQFVSEWFHFARHLLYRVHKNSITWAFLSQPAPHKLDDAYVYISDNEENNVIIIKGTDQNGPSPKRPQWRSKTAHANQNGPNGRKNKTKTAPANIQNGPFSCPKRPIT